jgi:predicted PurR-regulated permease PerM
MINNRASSPVRLLIAAGAAIIILAGMREAAGFVGLIILAIFLAVLGTPVIEWFERRRVPKWAALTLVIFLVVVLFFALLALFAFSFIQWSSSVSTYDDELRTGVTGLQTWLGSRGIDLSVQSFLPAGTSLINVITALLRRASSALLSFFVVVISTSFLLLEVSRIRSKLATGLGLQSGNPVLAQLTGFRTDLIEFVVVRIKVNAIAGILVTVLLLLLGVPLALLWGVLFFLLGFIPYIGFIVATIPPTFLALLQYGPLGAIIVLIGILILNGIVEYVVFPQWSGVKLNLSPFVVFISVIFWDLILGPLGALLSVPLTLLLQRLLLSFDETRWLANLMAT